MIDERPLGTAIWHLTERLGVMGQAATAHIDRRSFLSTSITGTIVVKSKGSSFEVITEN